MIAHVISRREERVVQAVETAVNLGAEKVVVGLHSIDPDWFPPPEAEVVRGSDYVGLTNDVLALSAEYGECTLRVDDDDEYPEDHGRIVQWWRPGATVWGLVEVVTCSGEFVMRDHPDMSAGVLPTGIVLEADKTGRLAQSLRQQTEEIVVPTKVRKIMCPGDWSWSAPFPRQRSILTCEHAEHNKKTP
jgi:hypothetical protein